VNKREYGSLHVQARREAKKLAIEARRSIKREYERIVKDVCSAIRESKGKPDWEARIRNAVDAERLYNFLLSLIRSCAKRGAQFIANIEKQCLLEKLAKAKGHGFDTEKIARLYDSFAEKRVSKVMNRADGGTFKNTQRKYTGKGWGGYSGRSGKTGKGVGRYAFNPDTGKNEWVQEISFDYEFKQRFSLSRSVWDISKHTEADILSVVWEGRANGEDGVSIARRLQSCLKGGDGKIMQGRWGKLRPDSQRRAEWLKALKESGFNPRSKEAQALLKSLEGERPDAVRAYYRRVGAGGLDYRAIRKTRSEIYSNMQEAVVEADEMNPATTGMFEWVLQQGRENWNCNCPDLARDGPYTKDNVPGYPHPNCDCMVLPLLKDHEEFMQQLLDYADGKDTPGAQEIREWSDKYDCRQEQADKDAVETVPPLTEQELNAIPPVKIERSVNYSQFELERAKCIEFEYLRQYTKKHGVELISIMGVENRF
jgi:hypothetical protein